jgi:autotransporter-associated beta strand protein
MGAISTTASLALALAITQAANAGTFYWDTNSTSAGSGAATGTWDTSTASWTTDSTGVAAPGALTTSILDNLFFSAGTNGTTGTVTVSGTQSANSITFDDPVAVTISGGTAIMLGGGSGAGIFQTGAGTVTNTISSSLTLNGGQAWTNSTSGSTLAISGTVTRNTGASVNFTPTGTINLTGSSLANDISGILGGWATVGNGGGSGATADWAALDGSGNIVTYTGYTNITTNMGAGSYSAQNWKNSVANVALTASLTVNSLVVTQDFSVSSGATMTLGSGGLILSGVSRWVKNNGNGNTSGTGQITSGLTSGELFVDVADATATDWRIWTKVVDNGGTAVKLVKNGPGYVRLENANTYTGGTIINAGTIFLSNNGAAGGNNALGGGTVTMNGGTLNLNSATLANNFTISAGASATVENSSNNGTLNGNFSGGGTITFQNSSGTGLSEFFGGTWSGFTGTLNYNGQASNANFNIFGAANMDLSNATVNFSNRRPGSSFRTGAGTTKFGSLSGDGYLEANNSVEIGALNTSTTFSGILQNAGSITKVGSGTLILSGANNYTGGTTVSGGTLQMNSANATSASVTVNTGGTLALNAGDALGFTADKNVPTINSGGTITNIMSAGRVTLWNGLTMTGGTLTGTGAGDANGAYSLSQTVVATSDVSGNAATISGGPISFQNRNTANGAITFNVSRGSAIPASDLNVSANLIANSGVLNVGLAKTGNGIMTLSAANTYTGGTAINGGKLVVNGSTAAASAVTVAAGTVTATPVATLGGTGTVGGSVALSAESAAGFKNGGVLAPTASASGTALKVTGTTTFNTGSIFEWDLNAVTADPGNGTANNGNYGQLAGTGAITGSDSVFQIVLGSNSFSDAFWNTDKSWTNIITGSGATTNLASIFSGGFKGSGVDASGVVLNRGSFTFSGTSTLTWSAVPEPSSALAGILICAGMFRRRRH